MSVQIKFEQLDDIPENYISSNEGFFLNTKEIGDIDHEEDSPKDYYYFSDVLDVREESQAFGHISFDSLRTKFTSIHGDYEVSKRVIKNGLDISLPPNSQVHFKYFGYIEFLDEPFDSTILHNERKTIQTLGSGALIKGLDIAITSMKKYEVAQFLIKPELAYGINGCPPRIPPNSEVLFQVELLDFDTTSTASSNNKLSDDDRKKFLVVRKKVKSELKTNADYFKQSKFSLAKNGYEKIIIWLERAVLENDEEEHEWKKLFNRTLTNLMVCFNKLNQPKRVCSNFDRIHRTIDDPNSKAYFNYGKALKRLGDYEKSLKQLQKASKLAPEDSDISTEIKEVTGILESYKAICEKLHKNSIERNTDQFKETVISMCQNFITNSELQQIPVPDNLTQDDKACIIETASSKNLSVKTTDRFNSKRFYLIKPSFK